ncbi:unnamed protein product [Cylindrotheca closterium]|uniref:Uncharacterized protein n=1 Tax=Cylindrotheca closterium TaxID=2856 RepID=A0AAD2G6R3_9STRA|nr:unnamed protein product [Cylindrotheca closterium]
MSQDYTKFDEGIDYTVLSIAVQTLALILFVEIVKHKLDHFAHGRAFFGTVLHSMYDELSTLGIVELVVYLALKYLRDYDQAKKGVFADVHFCLFYIAVFNAFQTVIVAMATKRTSTKQWVDTEKIDISHYIEIREEFDAVASKLGYEDDYEAANVATLKGFFQDVAQSVRSPGLRGHYLDLLVQVKFHGLRTHFLTANSLPLTLKVSDYLKRSEERVLSKLVHVSGGAWLMLTGCLSLAYFLMGMVAYVSEDQEVVGRFLKGIFFFMLLIFILISVAVYFKMKSTFHTIITTNYKMSKMDDKTRATGMKSQKDLFWLGEPQFVISMIQFMQFGYALALAVVLMYWKSFTTFEPYYFLLAVVACYSIFVFIVSRTLPQYTLCTSLGYLIDEKNLLETVALDRLEEARRLRIQSMAEANCEEDSIVSFESSERFGAKMRGDSTVSDDSGRITPTGIPNRSSILAELVQSDTQSLRTNLPTSVRQSLRDRESRRLEKRKSLSDGVGSMRLSLRSSKGESSRFLLESQPTSEHSDESQRTVDDSQILNQQRMERVATRKAQQRAMSESSVIQSWQGITKKERKLGGISLSKQSSSLSDSSSVAANDRSGSASLAKADQSSMRPSQRAGSFSTKETFGSEVQSTVKTVESDIHDETNLAAAAERTDDSVGALSDVDVKDWTPSEHTGTVDEKKYDYSFQGILAYTRSYLLGHRYHTFSHVFGSLVCFFLVGHRVEVMLSATGAIEPSANTWELDLSISFWVQAIWYGLFILSSILILILFLPIKVKSMDDKAIIAAGLFDFMLSGGCLAILFLAEAERCCDSSEFEGDVGCCPFWGSRTYGGLGDIEPFTSLIGLRVFRFMAARSLVKYYEHLQKDSVEGKNIEPKSEKKHSDGHSMQSQVGTPLELWEKAITAYPDIVEKYGQLSGELFEAMLGLEVFEGKPPDAMKEEKKNRQRSISLSGSEYGNLPADAQSIIVAGKLGKPVKTLHDPKNDLPALAEEVDQDDLELDGAVKSQPIVFEIDNERLALEKVTHSSFVAPNARLIRSMRRCDRKMLPILTDWECVDVVLTEFEVLYFETNDPRTVASKSHNDECSLLALQATGGGKGLRLQDVAKGRKIIGHMMLTDVTEIHVERSMPLSCSSQNEDISQLYDSDDQLPTELWTRSQGKSKATGCRKARWEKIKEDRLKLVSSHGCLVLRFFSDLEDVEMHSKSVAPEDEAQGPLRKNIAFQWAQTVAHVCGKEKLHQSLPHFGENNSDELRDLLEFANNHEKEHSIVLKNLKEKTVANPVKPTIRRSHSMETERFGLKGRIRRRLSLSSQGTQNFVSPKDGVVEELQSAEATEQKGLKNIDGMEWT